MILCDHYTHNACITLRGVSTSVLQESQGLTTYTFVMLLLEMISLHMLTCRLMVIMVAEFCSLVILIHNTLLGEITIIWEAREWYCLPGAIYIDVITILIIGVLNFTITPISTFSGAFVSEIQ